MQEDWKINRMQNDLISRSALIETLRNKQPHLDLLASMIVSEVIEIIKEQPTAYDVEKVVEQTNADRIRAMSDKKLAKEIAEKIACSECPFNGDEDKCGNVGCSELFLEYLQSEVEE